MRLAVLSGLLAVATGSAIPSSDLSPRQTCTNTATTRSCWADGFDIDTNWYTDIPSTGVIRQYWLSVENTTSAPDGVSRQTLTFNGTIPGPTIVADWGDEIWVHVTNNLEHNGTAIHWHGLHMVNNSENDGVPGITQCPIAPGDSLTYKFNATQYGSSWYHSHMTLQYGDGLLGPIIINGPATANYDEDLGVAFMTDWPHDTAFSLWHTAAQGGPPTMENTLFNGTNTFGDGGAKSVTVVEEGKSYRLRLVNTATDGHFEFSIDGHSFQVIANDFVPIVPFTTQSLPIGIGQRYDIVFTANNATETNYWIRMGWVSACSTNGDPGNATAILRYDASSTAFPVTSSNVTISQTCYDADYASLVPHVPVAVGASAFTSTEALDFSFTNAFFWTINTSSLYLNWSNPTNLRIYNGDQIFPTPYNVISLPQVDEWVYIIIQDESGLGISHPMHLHGHDTSVIAQGTGTFDITTTTLNLSNPPRRDTMTLPGNGYLAMAFKTDNPGSWITHCHIAWHASQGLALQFVERQDEILGTLREPEIYQDTCDAWNQYTPIETYKQDDSGI